MRCTGSRCPHSVRCPGAGPRRSGRVGSPATVAVRSPGICEGRRPLIGFVVDTDEQAAEDFYPGYAEMFTKFGRERGFASVARAGYQAQRGPDVPPLIDDAETLASRPGHLRGARGISRLNCRDGQRDDAAREDAAEHRAARFEGHPAGRRHPQRAVHAVADGQGAAPASAAAPSAGDGLGQPRWPPHSDCLEGTQRRAAPTLRCRQPARDRARSPN